MAASAFGRFEVFQGESFPPSPNYYYIDAPIEVEAKKKITYALKALPPQDNVSVLVQFWGATKINRKIHLLTTTRLPFALSGNNQQLQEYRTGCWHQKLYVYEDSKEGKGKAFGLPGIVFLNLTHGQTQNMHDYPEDERPPCEVSIFERIWGSYVLPVFEADKCIGVLEFVLDAPKDSYNDDIFVAYSVLQQAGFQSSIQIHRPRELEMISSKKRGRKTKTSDVTKYSRLVPYMGLNKAIAAEKLGQSGDAKKAFTESTFRNLRENVGIPEWPWIRNSTAKATSVLGTQMNPTIYESGSCLTNTADLTSFSGNWFPDLSWEQPMIAIPFTQETGINQIEIAYPGFMLECGEMEYQVNNASITEDTDIMDSEEWINEYLHKNDV